MHDVMKRTEHSGRRARSYSALTRFAHASLPIWLMITTFAVHVRPEAVALTALTVAIVTGLAATNSQSGPRLAGVIGLFVAGAAVVAALLLTGELVSTRDRVPILQPLSVDLMISAAIIMLATLLLAWRRLGLGVTVIVGSLVLYALFGHLFSGSLGHGLIRPGHFLDLMFFTTDGLLGTPLAVATGTVVHFLAFASVIERTGATAVFCEFAVRLCGGGRGGPAKAAVASSAFFGTISGSPTSDVVATGSMTVPAMCKAGYSRIKAAAIEVAASTGGSILPPVMGTAAFILAEYTGTPYSQIVFAALLPGLLYYATLYLCVDLDARRYDYKAVPTGLAQAGGLRSYVQLVLPAGVLVVVLLRGYPPAFAAAAGTVAAMTASLVRPGGLLTLREIATALESTGRRMIPVLAACAAAGLIIGSVTMSGLTGKAATLLLSITGGAIIPTLLAAAVAAMLFGLGMPTSSAYILGAMLLAPAVTDIGVPLLPAHLFVLYYAVLSALTPPVAVAAFAVASISGGSPYAIGFGAMRFAVAAFVLPFAFVASPGLLLDGDWAEIAVAVLGSAIGLAAIAIAITGVVQRPLRGYERVSSAAGGCLILTADATTVTVGILLLGFALVRQMLGWRALR